MAVLDLQVMGTQQLAEPASLNNPGVAIQAPYRTERLLTTYAGLRDSGLPEGIPEATRCLLGQEGTLHSFSELRNGFYVENDHPELAAGVRAYGAGIACAEVTEATSTFFAAIGLRTLTSCIEAVHPRIGNEQPPPPDLGGTYVSRTIKKLHHREFLSALVELAAAEAAKRTSGTGR